MDNRLVESAKQLNKRRRRRQAWTRSLIALGCVVMLSTVYIMSLPAITKEQDTFCGAEAHEHTDACYQEREGETARVLICAPEHHVHEQTCFDAQGLPVCGQADYVAHSHDALCYDENGGLICALPERSVHVHTEDCYETVAGHTHGEACYEEAGGHTHSDGCYETVGGHTHGEACYETVGGHTHGDGCYETVAGHTHTESCYEVTGGHTHGEACYETVAGHTHSEACLAEDGQLICTLTEGEDRRELRCTEPETAGQQSLICTLEETEDETLLICPEPEAEGEKVLICTEPEAEGEKVLTCTEPEAEGERLLICTEPETEEKTLICREAQAAVHQHTQDCFGPEKEKVLTCTKKEHSHILQCYSDRKADVETPEQWEETFRDVELTGLHRDDLLAIARTQLGYRESVRNYTVKEDGETKDGYTRYGDWYGYPYSEWCAMFVSFCLEYAEVPDMPHHAACQAWIDILVEEELYLPVEEYTPWPGDIIFFDGNGDDYSDHVGIVEEITEEGMIKTIEGNSGRRVCQNEYEPDDPRLLGYGLVPEGELIPKETESAEPTDMPETAETAEPTEIPAETDDAVTEATKPETTEPETTEPETTEESTQPENTEIKQTRKVSVYRNHRRDELLPEADEIHVTGNYPEDAVVYAVPAEVEADGEILSAYQISILLPDYSVYQPTQEESLLLTVKNESFEGRTLEVRACPAEGASYELSASARGKMVAFHLPESAPFAVVAIPEALTEQTLQAVIYRDATLQQQSADETVILITGLLPQGAGARAYPLVLDENLIEGEKVLLAFDITIVDREGNPITQEEGQEPFTVSIRPPEWEPSEDENYKIYYVPEEGAPEIMDSENREDAVSFTTDHFSTYVLTAAGTYDTVYLNGANGDDSRAGTSANTAVKTLDRALALVKEGGTICISGTVTVSDAQEWEMENGITLKRYSSFTGPLVTVESGGSLTLKNITVNGGSGTPNSSTIATTATYASGSAKAPLIVVESGGSLNIRDGAVLEYNSNKPDMSNGTFKENGYVGQGGAVYCQGNLTMSGGIIRYCEAQSGGGIYVESAGTGRITFNLSGGTITYNYARDIVPSGDRKDTYHRNAGGGVYVGDYVTMNMTGGTISYNQTSREGGGISLGWLDRNKGAAINDFITTFNMSGGVLDHNVATSTGGGLNITAGREAYINAGDFTNNSANGYEYQPESGYSAPARVYSGGGIYLDAQQLNSRGGYAGKPGYALIHRVLITGNSSSSYCGGIATCQTSNTYIASSLQMDGTLIFGNKTGSSTNASQLSLAGDVSLVGKTALGGVAYNWTSSYKNSLSESNADVKRAMELATVRITGNDAFDGGGIGCNGQLEVGGSPSYESVSITKIWNDDGTVPHPDSVTVQVYRDGEPYGDPITLYPVVDAAGRETWPTVFVDKLLSGYTYTIKEVKVPGFDSQVTSSGNAFTITNTPTGFKVVKKWEGDIESDRPGSVSVQLYQDGQPYGEIVELNAAGGWQYMWMNLPEGFAYTAREVEVPDGYYITGEGTLLDEDTWQITNIKCPVTSLSVEKRWEGGEPLDSATVYLLSNGVQIDEVTLNADNGWFYRWDNLPACGKYGDPITYTLREADVKGFASSIEQGTLPDETTYFWQPVTELETGKSYMLVSSSDALTVSSSSLTWNDVSDILASGGEAAAAELWSMSDSRLKNGDGKYLTYSNQKFTISDRGSTVTWSDGKISSRPSWSTYYLSKSGSGVSATSTSSNAVTFTAYERVARTVEGSDLHYIVTNTKLPDAITFRFAKYAVGSSKNPTLLAGAGLELYMVSGDGDTVIPGTELTGKLIRRWTSEDGTAASGGLQTEDLYSGTYYLLETQTPSGHIGLSGPVIFEVLAEAGQVNLLRCPYELTLSGGPEIDFPIYNAVAYELPETGGIGTTPYTVGGLLLMIMALALLMYSHKRRKGEQPSF